jgi:hypothetical protein
MDTAVGLKEWVDVLEKHSPETEMKLKDRIIAFAYDQHGILFHPDDCDIEYGWFKRSVYKDREGNLFYRDPIPPGLEHRFGTDVLNSFMEWPMNRELVRTETEVRIYARSKHTIIGYDAASNASSKDEERFSPIASITISMYSTDIGPHAFQAFKRNDTNILGLNNLGSV